MSSAEVNFQELMSRTSTDDDFFPLPVEVVRTNSFPCIPGSEENNNDYRGIDFYNQFRSENSVFALQENTEKLALDGEAFSGEEYLNIQLEKPRLSKHVGANGTPREMAPAYALKQSKKSSFNFTVAPNCPYKPFHLVRTHFEVTDDIKPIVITIHETLATMAGVAFTYDESKSLWLTKCSDLNGCNTCLMEVQIYRTAMTAPSSSGNGSCMFIVEANRTAGDHEVFNSCYSRLCNAFSSDVDSMRGSFGPAATSASASTNHHDGFASTVGPFSPALFNTEVEAQEVIEPILAMAESDDMDCQIEASKILYDFAMNEDLLPCLCDTRCIDIMILLAQENAPEAARHNIFMTMALLATKSQWQEVIAEKQELFCVIMTTVVNGPYETAELRREGARTFESLSLSRVAHMIPSKVGKEPLFNWFSSVDDLQDERLKLHAERAREALRPFAESAF